MKSQNINNSSKKTIIIIKKVFAEMLSEKIELSKISVTELCKRADISRGSFYTHYDDIYCVAEEYENELIDAFFNSTILLEQKNIKQFIDYIFTYIRQNHQNYLLLCKSNDFIFAAKKLSMIASNKLLDLCLSDERIINHTYLELEIIIFIDGLFCEYVKMCRGYSNKNLDDLYNYTLYWVENFIIQHSKNKK